MCNTLLKISGFVLDQKFQRNASKFAIFYIYKKKTKLLFPFFISCYIIFLLMNALFYVDIDKGIHQVKTKNIKQHEMKNGKNQLLFFVYLYRIWQILKHFAGTFHRAQTLKLGGVRQRSSKQRPKATPVITARLRSFLPG